MKTFNKTIYILTLLTGTLLLSCGKSDDREDLNIETFFSAKVDDENQPYESKTAKAVLTKHTAGIPYTLYVEGKENYRLRNIKFTILSDTEPEPGVFIIKKYNNVEAVYIEDYGIPPQKYWMAPDDEGTDPDLSYGTINLTELTETRAKGTFNFNAVEDRGDTIRTITNGVFDVPLTRQGF